jgi:hypothetical protein
MPATKSVLMMLLAMGSSFAQMILILVELNTIAALYPLSSTRFSGFFLCALGA